MQNLTPAMESDALTSALEFSNMVMPEDVDVQAIIDSCETLLARIQLSKSKAAHPDDPALKCMTIQPSTEGKMLEMTASFLTSFFQNVFDQFASRHPKVYRRLVEQQMQLEHAHNRLTPVQKATIETTMIRTYSRDTITEILKLRAAMVMFLVKQTPLLLQAPEDIKYESYVNSLEKLADTLTKSSFIELTLDLDQAYIHPHININEEMLSLKMHGWTFSKTVEYIEELKEISKAEPELEHAFFALRDANKKNTAKVARISEMPDDKLAEQQDIAEAILRFSRCLKGAMAMMRTIRGIETRAIITETRLFLTTNNAISKFL